jgi:hypothetical protein
MSQAALLRWNALWQQSGPPRGRIHIRKIAGSITLAHEPGLPFWEGHLSQRGIVQRDYLAMKRHKKHKRKRFLHLQSFVLFVPFCG